MILLRYTGALQEGQLPSHPLGMVSFSQGAACRALLLNWACRVLSSQPNAGSLALTCAVARAPNVGWIIVEPSERWLQSLTLARVCRLRAPLAEPRGATREGGGPLPLGTTTPCLMAPNMSGLAERSMLSG
jgi:hypothetical protein